MKKYTTSKIKNIKLSADIITANDMKNNLSGIGYLDSSSVGQLEIVNTINSILSALKTEEEDEVQ